VGKTRVRRTKKNAGRQGHSENLSGKNGDLRGRDLKKKIKRGKKKGKFSSLRVKGTEKKISPTQKWS